MSFLGPKYNPDFAHKYIKLPRYEQDLMRYYDWLKFKEMQDDLDTYFRKKVVNLELQR